MSTYDEFNQMVEEVLNDPDLRSTGTLVTSETVALDPHKPWERTSSVVKHDVYCFYSKQKNTFVNGSVVQAGQKVVLFQLAVPEASLMAAKWIDHNKKEWAIKQLEAVELTDRILYFKAIIGA